MGIGIGDVTTVFAILVALGIVFPGLLLGWSLLLPQAVERAQERIVRTPWKSLLLGILGFLFASIPNVLLLRAAGPLQFIGFIELFVLMALVSIGAAGIARLMGERLRGAGVQATVPGALVRGAIALEFALIFPIIGWFILFPFVILISLGASIFALLRWTPRATQIANRVSPIANRISPIADQPLGELH